MPAATGGNLKATDEMDARGDTAPLGDLMLTMDVTDTLRHSPAVAEAPDAVDQLRRLYAQLGVDAPDTILSDGIAAHRDERFAYAPRAAGWRLALARLYVARRRWLPGALAVALLLLVVLIGYFVVFRPYQEAQVEKARVELGETMPAAIDALYQSIFEETKVTAAADRAADLRAKGKAAAQKGDRAGAEAAVADLTTIRDTLQAEYRLTIVDRPNVKWGFWTFPQNNSEETNYYLVVEPRANGGTVLTLPVLGAGGRTDSVKLWAVRVPEDVYRAVEADKADDGTIEQNLVGIKEYGFLQPDYLVTVLGGALTRW
jgi:hypothetical protein